MYNCSVKELKIIYHQFQKNIHYPTWYANSLVWHKTKAATCPATGSICCKVERTKTAVLPIPDFAWQMTSIPKIAWGIHSCWTDGEPNKLECSLDKLKWPSDPFNKKFYQKNFLHQNNEGISGLPDVIKKMKNHSWIDKQEHFMKT